MTQSKYIYNFALNGVEGIGKLIEIATLRDKEVNPKIKVSICGEHGGAPHPINFFKKTLLII